MADLLRDFIANETGATAIEYGLIAALVSIAAVVAFPYPATLHSAYPSNPAFLLALLWPANIHRQIVNVVVAENTSGKLLAKFAGKRRLLRRELCVVSHFFLRSKYS